MKHRHQTNDKRQEIRKQPKKPRQQTQTNTNPKIYTTSPKDTVLMDLVFQQCCNVFDELAWQPAMQPARKAGSNPDSQPDSQAAKE